MAAGTGGAEFPGTFCHQFFSRMAVDAGESALLVDVWSKIVVFHAIGSEMLLFGGIGCAIFLVQVVFEAAVIVKSDPVAVVTGQALPVAGAGEKGMGRNPAVLKTEMTGGTARAVGHGGIVVSLGIQVTAQAAATEEVVGETEDILW